MKGGNFKFILDQNLYTISYESYKIKTVTPSLPKSKPGVPSTNKPQNKPVISPPSSPKLNPSRPSMSGPRTNPLKQPTKSGKHKPKKSKHKATNLKERIDLNS